MLAGEHALRRRQLLKAAASAARALQAMKLGDSVVERLAFANYARVLKAALKA